MMFKIRITRLIIVIPLILLTFLISCQSGHSEREKITSADSVKVDKPSSPDSNDFQLLVKKIDDPTRGDWQNPQLVIRELGDLTGKTVVDIGAGTGYFTFRIAPDAAKVIAVDIDKRFLNFIDEKKLEYEGEWVNHIQTRLTVSDDPALKKGEVDDVLIVNTFHFLKDRINYLKKVKEGMKPGGILLIVDFKEGNFSVSPPPDLIVPPDEATSEIKAAGFKQISVDLLSLQYQYIIKATL